MNIQVLDSKLIDKIAAGEVLERPAQLVKELVENSLDAGATEIDVDVHQGGRELRVTDNGHGIAADQLGLALHRHATSKIRDVEDLFCLSSFGFRGEALSSASAVSRMTLTSRTRDRDLGVRRESLFGGDGASDEVASPVGTTIWVRDLFENVPARLKFLKSDGAELQHIKSCMKAFGLSHPQVSFKFSVRGHLEFYWPRTEHLIRRAEDILGVKPLYESFGEEYGIQTRIYFSAPNQTLKQNKGIWIFVQGRWVQDRTIGAAVMEGYRNLLMHGEYPQCVVQLELPKDQVDVNVHPTKSQVKFLNSSEVFRAVAHALRAGLSQTPWLSNLAVSQESAAPQMAFSSSNEASPVYQTSFETLGFKQTHLPRKDYVLKDSGPLPTMEQLRDLSPKMDVPLEAQRPIASAFQWSQLHVVGQTHQTYIVAQSQDEFYLIDQHAAHERVVFERLMRNWKEEKFSTQTYLIPLNLDFSEDDVERLMAVKDTLSQMGLDVDQMGPQTLAVNSSPEFITESGVARALNLFAEQLNRHGDGFAVERVIGDIFASMACHSVIRAGQTLSREEMASLLKQMDEFPFSSFCPHGGPLFVKKTFLQIDREFGRIV